MKHFQRMKKGRENVRPDLVDFREGGKREALGREGECVIFVSPVRERKERLGPSECSKEKISSCEKVRVIRDGC